MDRKMWLIVICIIGFLSFTTAAYNSNEASFADSGINEQCKVPNVYLTRDQKCNMTRIYILDFSCDFLTSDEFDYMKSKMIESAKDFFNAYQDENVIVKVRKIDAIIGDDSEHHYYGSIGCKTSIECEGFISTIQYEDVIQEHWNANELVNVNQNYANNLSEIFKSSFGFYTCGFNSIVLLTNQIIDIKNSNTDFSNLSNFSCIQFSVILFGRNECDAPNDLLKYYGYIPYSTVYNIPDYNALLIDHIMNCLPCSLTIIDPTCLNTTIPYISADCTTEIPTTPSHITTTTTKTMDAFCVTYILGFTSNFGQFFLDLLLSNLIPPVQKIADNGPIKINFVITSYTIIKEMETVKEFTKLVTNITAFLNEYNMNNAEFFQRIKLGINATHFGNNYETKVILLTDYFPSPNLSAPISTDDYNLLYNSYLWIYVYNMTAYELYGQNNITSYLSNYTQTIPLMPDFTSTTMNQVGTPFSSTKSTTKTSTVMPMITTTQKNDNATRSKPSTSNNNEKTKIIIIISSIVAVFGIILFLCFLFYRRHLQQKRIEEIRLSHQNPAEFDEWELSWDKLMIKNEELGSGAYGQVLQGKLMEIHKTCFTKNGKHLEDSKEVAIKILQRYTNEISEKHFLNEIQMMKQITANGHHKNIVKMIGCITVGDRICLVLEFCSYRDLLQYAKIKNTELISFLQTVEHIKKEFLIFAWQISQGMQFLASQGIIHRDLAARNILIDEFKIAKISDFGLCVQINDKLKNSPSNNILHLETGKLPLKWLAIESLKNYEFSLQSDVWAFGIVLYEMYSFGGIPFSDVDPSELLKHLENGNRPEQPEICPDEIYIIMIKCWNSNPSLRPFFDELITIFTVFLERATENYGYLDVIKSEKNNQKELKQIICYDEC